MSRQLRTTLPAHGIFHVTARGVERRMIFADDDDRRFFLGIVDLAQARHRWNILAYCLLTNHVHFLLEAARIDVTQGMQLLLSRYAQSFNARYERTGHLFQGRFHARAVEDDEYLERVCDYVLDNAVRAGLCRERSQWPWLGGALAN